MAEKRIEADVVYNHNKYGEVLVTGVAKMYDAWDVTGPTDDIESGNVIVFFHSRFDGYGGMQPTPTTETVGDFAKRASRIESFEYVDVPELQERNVREQIPERRDIDEE